MAWIDREALFSDETAMFRSPVHAEAGDVVVFRFRARKDNVERVVLYSRTVQREMKKIRTEGAFDIYETSVRIGQEFFLYAFLVTAENDSCYYSRAGVSTQPPSAAGMFRVLPGFSTPDWAKGAVFYQIFTDRFFNGDPSNDVLTDEYAYAKRHSERVEDWFEPLKPWDVNRFYGGDLIGVEKKLDYLKHLGVEAIYLNPIFVSPSNHKYDTQDYEHIDPHLTGFAVDEGELLDPKDDNNRHAERYICRVTDEKNLEKADAYFAHLTEEIHKRGMKVILDGVFNHCGSMNRFMDGEGIYEKRDGAVGAFHREDSPYHDYFLFDEEGEWPENDQYMGWWGFKTLPKLNYEGSQKLHDYILGIAKKWLKPPYNVDGWRLDVAADLGLTSAYNHEFWREFRQAVKSVNPEALILAEHYGSPEHWLRGDQWDSVMNYDAFMDPVSYFLTGMEKHSDEYREDLQGNGPEFFAMLKQHMDDFPLSSLLVAMNELSNHDHSRFMTRTNHQVGRLSTVGAEAAGRGVSYAIFRAGVVMQFTLPGAPTIYYGDETGMVGWTDPDSRRTYPWGSENFELIAFHRDMIRVHQAYSCLRTGSFRSLAADQGYIAYGRFDEHSAALVLVNTTYEERAAEIRTELCLIPPNARLTRVMAAGERGYNVGKVSGMTENGVFRTTVPAFTAEVFVAEF